MFGFAKKKRWNHEKIQIMYNENDYTKLKTLWSNPDLFTTEDNFGDNYGGDTLFEEYHTLLTDAFTANVVSGNDTFEMFKFLTDLGMKIDTPGKLDDDDYMCIEMMFGSDREVGDYDKFLDYVKPQVINIDIMQLLKELNYKPIWVKIPFKLWVSKQDDMSELQQSLFDYTQDEILIPDDAREMFLF